jgi:hypothetical protein
MCAVIKRDNYFRKDGVKENEEIGRNTLQGSPKYL